MLVPSGNDATLALARHVGGLVLAKPFTDAQAVEAFISLMNDKAKELGASASHFVNPTGIDADGHVMSARDVVIVAEAVLRNPVLAETISTPDCGTSISKAARGIQRDDYQSSPSGGPGPQW